MVTRVYKCSSCGEVELRQSVKDKLKEVCECGRELRYQFKCEGDILNGFYSGISGAITKRYLEKGGANNPWNLRNA